MEKAIECGKLDSGETFGAKVKAEGTEEFPVGRWA